ncbi:Uncharacterised protein [Citrobacter braakii]|nr:Uncharacterised protein [Citrobacter braakii]
MAISHDIGLFFPFKVNRPLTKEEKQSRFVQGKRRKVFGEAAVLDLDTVIRMNSSYLEVVDKFYPTKGYVASFMMAFCVLFIITLVAFAKITIFKGDGFLFFCFAALLLGGGGGFVFLVDFY